MFYLIEIFIAAIITVFFILKEKPKLRFLFLGYIFFFVSLILQIPFRYFELKFTYFFESVFFSSFTIAIITIIISEFTKYFSLKKFLKTRSYKNAILFAIGWSTIESINFLTSNFYQIIFSLVPINFNYANFMPAELSFFNFVFFFILNLAITVFVIFSLIKNNKLYVFFAILFSIIVYLGFVIFSDFISKIVFTALVFAYSLFVIFHYRKLK